EPAGRCAGVPNGLQDRRGLVGREQGAAAPQPRRPNLSRMASTGVFRSTSISVIDYRCEARPADAPFAECHDSFSLAYVRKGTFGCRALGRSFELVTGAFLVGPPGDDDICTHEHAAGDECLSFHFAPALVEAIGYRPDLWRTVCVPPLSPLMVVG